MVPELATALKMLEPEKFTKMIAFLRSGVGQRVRTNNHVERMNRWLRLYEKTRYKWRSARTKVRFVWLLVDRRWGAQARTWANQHGGGGGRQLKQKPNPTWIPLATLQESSRGLHEPSQLSALASSVNNNRPNATGLRVLPAASDDPTPSQDWSDQGENHRRFVVAQILSA